MPVRIDMPETVRPHPTHPHLRQAPITEAVLEVRCALPSISSELLVEFERRLHPAYGKRQDRVHFQVEVQDAGVASTRQVNGVVLQHSSEPYVVQARFDGFALSRLRPYERYNVLRDEAARLWEIYVDVFRPTMVLRLGLRYINSIPLDLDQDPADTLTFLPVVPRPVAPTGYTSFTIQVSSEYPDFGAAANVLQHLPPIPSEASMAGVVLDIDVYRHTELDPADGAAWTHLDQLSELKNVIFFSCLTPAALKRFT